MRLIFDCGSTKCSIVQLDKDGNVLNSIKVKGFNPIMHSNIENATYSHFNKLLTQSFSDVSELLYCGAGCINQTINKEVQKGLARIFEWAQITICSDLEFIGHVLGIKERSIIGILGTGSNAGLWDGQNVVTSTLSGGYLLGDEGSGFSMGKKMIINYLRENFEPQCQQFLEKEIGESNDQLIQSVYTSDTPNQKIASYAALLNKIDDPLKDKIISDSFQEYFDNRVKPLIHDVEIIHLFGSVAYFNQSYLKPILDKLNLRLGLISREPLDIIQK